eukprot:6532072-Pyramimonas_sp.AAC.1
MRGAVTEEAETAEEVEGTRSRSQNMNQNRSFWKQEASEFGRGKLGPLFPDGPIEPLESGSLVSLVSLVSP